MIIGHSRALPREILILMGKSDRYDVLYVVIMIHDDLRPSLSIHSVFVKEFRAALSFCSDCPVV